MFSVSVIIPTLCSKDRTNLLLRAISSCLAQEDLSVEIIIVVNGDRLDTELYQKINSDNRLSVFYLSEGNVSKARYYGIQQSSNDYFCFLDDDDELIPNTLVDRVAILSKNKQTAVVVSNGYFVDGEKKTLLVDDEFYQQILSSPVFGFLRKNWFTTPAALYNKKCISMGFFDIEYRYFELSYLFYKLIENNYNIEFIKQAGYNYYEDTANSASKSESYMLAYPEMLKIIMSMNLQEPVKKKLEDKYIVALNSVSVFYLNKKQFKQSFFYHYQCVINGGFSYFLYTRLIVKEFVLSKFSIS